MIYLAILETEDERLKFSDVYTANHDWLVKTAKWLLNDNDMAEDVVHDVWLRVINHKMKVLPLPTDELRDWLFIALKKKCQDYSELSRHKHEVQPEDWHEEPESDDYVEQTVINKEMVDKIRKNINELDELNRSILTMRFVLEMTTKEIAAEVGLTPAQVDNRISRNRAKVKYLTERETQYHENI